MKLEVRFSLVSLFGKSAEDELSYCITFYSPPTNPAHESVAIVHVKE